MNVHFTDCYIQLLMISYTTFPFTPQRIRYTCAIIYLQDDLIACDGGVRLSTHKCKTLIPVDFIYTKIIFS